MINPLPSHIWPPEWRDTERATQAAVRYRMAHHAWEQDLTDFTEALQGSEKLGALGIIDFSCNPLAALGKQLSSPGVYGDTPDIYGPPGSDLLIDRAPAVGGGQGGYLQRAGWAALMPYVDYCVRTLECVAVVPVIDEAYTDHPRGPLSLRVVYPHALHVEVHRDRPTEALVVWEARMWTPPATDSQPSPEEVPVWYRWDISDPARPRFDVYKIEAPTTATQGRENRHNITAEVFPGGDLSGDGYPWRYDAGRGAPFIPHTFYRLSSAAFWGDNDVRALHRGTFHAANSINWGHYTTRAAAANPTITVDCAPLGAADVKNPLELGEIRVLPLVPGAVLPLTRTSEGVQPQVIMAGPGVDPSVIYRAVGDYVSDLLAAYGLSGKSSTRDHANPTSAAALSIHDSDKRVEQRRGVESFRASDEELFRKCAAMLSASTGERIPESGYRVGYKLLPLSTDEQEEQRDDLTFRLDKGLASKVDAYVELNPGVDRETAIAHLRRVQRDEQILAEQQDRSDAITELREALASDQPEELREACAEALAILTGDALPEMPEGGEE